jgi:hypothetical protein
MTEKKQPSILGESSCRLCGGTPIVIKLSTGAKPLAYYNCPACQVQVFARSGRSDELLRDSIKNRELKPAPKAEPAANEDAKPAPGRESAAVAAGDEWDPF